MSTSLRTVTNIMDPMLPSISLRTLARYYRWPNNSLLPTVSLDVLGNRSLSPNCITIRFLSYNTYLMRVDIPIGSFLDTVVGLQGLLRLLGVDPVDILEKMNITARKAIEAMGISKVKQIALLGLNPFVALAGLSLSAAMSLFGIEALNLLSRLISPSGILDLLGITIDIPFGNKPALESRGTEIGQELVGQYQIMALCEVWQQDSLDRILAGWPVSPHIVQGPQINFNDAKTETAIGSGLAVLSTLPVVDTESHIFEFKGVDRTIAGFGNLNHLVDIDTWAKKSVMLTRVNTSIGIIDLYNTHLYSGGDAIEFLGWAGLSKPSDKEKRTVRIGQIHEFINFYKQTHNPENVAILTGDFNINGINKELFNELNNLLVAVGFEELWTKSVYVNPQGGGQTNRSGDPNTSFAPVCKQRQPDLFKPNSINQNDYYCDDFQASDDGASGERIDYLYIEQPTKAHGYNLEITRPRRRPFLRKQATDGELYLSDHMGLDVTLLISPKHV